MGAIDGAALNTQMAQELRKWIKALDNPSNTLHHNIATIAQKIAQKDDRQLEAKWEKYVYRITEECMNQANAPVFRRIAFELFPKDTKALIPYLIDPAAYQNILIASSDPIKAVKQLVYLVHRIARQKFRKLDKLYLEFDAIHKTLQEQLKDYSKLTPNLKERLHKLACGLQACEVQLAKLDDECVKVMETVVEKDKEYRASMGVVSQSLMSFGSLTSSTSYMMPNPAGAAALGALALLISGIVYLGQRMASDTVLEDRPTTKQHKYKRESNHVSWAREPSSSGLIGRHFLRKEESGPLGRVCLQLPKRGVVDLKYNLKSPYRVLPSDAQNLSAALIEEVRSGKMPPKDCLELLNDLETTIVARKKKLTKEKPVFGFIAPEATFLFDRLKRMCERMLAANPPAALPTIPKKDVKLDAASLGLEPEDLEGFDDFIVL